MFLFLVTLLIPELVMKLSRGHKIDIIKSMFLSNSLTIASPIGIPLTLNSSVAVVGKVDGFVKVNNLPSVTEMFRSGSISAPRVSLDVNLKPTYVARFPHAKYLTDVQF